MLCDETASFPRAEMCFIGYIVDFKGQCIPVDLSQAGYGLVGRELANKALQLFREKICAAVPRLADSSLTGISELVVDLPDRRYWNVREEKNKKGVTTYVHISNVDKSVPRTVALQAHLDMVGVKAEGSTHDFLTQPITTEIALVGNLACLVANDTSLGADDGTGVSLALTLILLAPSVAETPGLDFLPYIEVLFTTNEETTMEGAKAVPANLLQAPVLCNLDSEELTSITTGSAGGYTSTFPANNRVLEFMRCETAYFIEINVTGVTGGHSGLEIHKQGANAIKVMARLVQFMVKGFAARIVTFSGGTAHNAIPISSRAVVNFGSAERLDKAISEIKGLVYELQDTYKITDPSMSITISKFVPSGDLGCLWDEPSYWVAWLLTEMPNGVQEWEPEGPPAVRSSCNVARIDIGARRPASGRLQISVRSVSEAFMDEFDHRIDGVLAYARQIFDYTPPENRYPAWDSKEGSELLARLEKIYADNLKGRPFTSGKVHAGLECGEILSKHPKMEAISIGPTIRGAHTISERLYLDDYFVFCDIFLEFLWRLALPRTSEMRYDIDLD